MRRRDRRQWEEASTLQDLAYLTAKWLTGEIKELPNYFGKCDVDFHAPGLFEALIELNRAGLLTDDSQGGCEGIGLYGAYWYQLAAVTGFADDDTCGWLQEVVRGSSVEIMTNRCGPRAEVVEVTWREDIPSSDYSTWYGWNGDEGEIAFDYADGSAEAIAAVCAAWQVTIYDPEPGRNDMWELLRQAAEDRLDR